MSRPDVPYPVARALYDALMGERNLVHRWLVDARRDGVVEIIDEFEAVLERADAALAEAADYLQGATT